MEIPSCTSSTFKNTLPYIVGGALVITLLVVGILASLETGPFASFAYTEVVSVVTFFTAALVIVGGVLYFRLCKSQWERREILESDGEVHSKKNSITLIRTNTPPPEENVSGNSFSLPLTDPYGQVRTVLFLKTYSKEEFLRVGGNVLGAPIEIPETNAFAHYSCEQFIQLGGTYFQLPLAFGQLQDGWFVAANYLYKSEDEIYEEGVIALVAKNNHGYVHWHTETLKGSVTSSYDQTDPTSYIGHCMDNPDMDDVSLMLHAFIQGQSHSVTMQFTDGTWRNVEYILYQPSTYS